jgi:hypothetical protein
MKLAHRGEGRSKNSYNCYEEYGGSFETKHNLNSVAEGCPLSKNRTVKLFMKALVRKSIKS